MNNQILKSTAWIHVAILPFFCLCSCVVDSYEWDEVDTSLNIQTNVGVPIGNSELITISSLLGFENSSMLYQDAEGYYYFSYSSDTVSEIFEISKFTLEEGKFIEDVDFELNSIKLKSRFFEQTGNTGDYSDIDQSLIYIGDLESVEVDDVIENGTISYTFSIEEDVSSLAADIEEISYIYLNAPVKAYISMNVTYSENRQTEGEEVSVATSGFKITFPEYMDISSNSAELSIDENYPNVLNLDTDMAMTSTQPIELSFNLDGIDMLALKDSNGELGYVGDSETRFIKIEGEVGISDLVLQFDPSDYGQTLADVPDEIEFSFEMESESFSVSGANVKMCSKFEIEDIDVEIEETFDFLEGDNNIIDLYNPVITLNVDNSTPMAATFSASLKSYAEGGYEYTTDIGTGNPVIFRCFEDASSCKSTIYFSKRAVEMSSESDYIENIIIEDLSDIFSHLPYKVSISNIDLSAYYENNDDYTLIQFPSDSEYLEYGFEFDYGVNLPLAFDEGLSISYFYDIAGLGELLDSESDNSQVYVNYATLKMTFVNSIPLQMNLMASALDTDGNILEAGDLEIEVSSSDGGEAIVMGGDIDSPVESEILLTLNLGGQVLETFDGFRLNITAGCSDELAGLQLNSDQYVQIKDITLYFDGEIDVEL